VLGQLLVLRSTPVFRFRSLTAAADAQRWVVTAKRWSCLQLGRLCAGILPPYELSREITLERVENTKQWLSSLAVPSGVRSTAFGVFGGLTGHDRARCALAFEDLVKAAFAQLDESSRAELNALIHELVSTPSVGARHTLLGYPIRA
jgi:hypothetical protein